MPVKSERVQLSPQGQRYFERAGVISYNPDFTIVEAEVDSFWGPYESNRGGMEIHWSTVSAGFGRLIIHITNEGKLKAETEGMSKEFCKAILSKIVDDWEEEK